MVDCLLSACVFSAQYHIREFSFTVSNIHFFCLVCRLRYLMQLFSLNNFVFTLAISKGIAIGY